MQAIQLSIMQQLIKLLAPSSPAYGNANNPFYIKQKDQSLDFMEKLQPCDIIFTKTSNPIYNFGRGFLKIEYDHVAVVINKNQILHISPPIISKVPIHCIVSKCRSPLIIRPELNSQQKQSFLKCITNLLGTKYSVSSLPKMFFYELQRKLNLPENIQFTYQNLKQSRICSDAIISALSQSSQKLKTRFSKYISQTNFNHIGFIMPDELANFLMKYYPIIYKSPIHKSGLVGQKIQQGFKIIFQKSKKLSEVLSVSLKIMAMLKFPKIKFLDKFVKIRSGISSTLYAMTLTMTICNLLGVKSENKKKIVVAAVLLTILTTQYSSILQSADQIQKKYESPEFNSVEKLKLPKL